MARTRRDGKVDTRTARLKLKLSAEPYWSTLAPGESLGYYRPRSGGAGTWWARLRLEGGSYRKRTIGQADDFTEADGHAVLSWAQAQATARAWFDLGRQDTGETPGRRGPFTVADAWALYREDCLRRGVRAMSRLDCAWTLHIAPAFASLEVEKLSQARIERWHLALAEAPPRRRPKRFTTEAAEGPRPATDDERRKRRASANRVLTILKSALNLAKRRRKVACPADAWREVQPFAHADAPRVQFLSLEEQARLVNACPADFRRLVQGALFTGARFQELARLRAVDFDRENGSVWIAPGKSGKGRHVALTEEGQDFFLEATAGLEGAALIFTHEAFADMRRVDPKTGQAVPRARRPWRASDQKRPMASACGAAKIPTMGFHQLRHSYASALVNAGVPLAFIAQQLGHSDTRMVERHYGHLAPSALKDAIRRLAPRLGIHEPGKVAGLKIKRG